MPAHLLAAVFPVLRGCRTAAFQMVKCKTALLEPTITAAEVLTLDLHICLLRALSLFIRGATLRHGCLRSHLARLDLHINFQRHFLIYFDISQKNVNYLQ